MTLETSIMACHDMGIDLEEMFPLDVVPEKLPSEYSKEIQLLSNSFTARKEYISKVGFALLTQEFIFTLLNSFADKDIKTFVEIEAGTGALTTVLNNSNRVSGVGYTLEIPEEKHHWGLTTSSWFYANSSLSETLKFQNIKKLKLDYKPDVIIASWIPYEAGEEVIEFFNNQLPQYYPEYFLLIGEGPGGCTANDEFFDWLEENWEVVPTEYSYTPFFGIYDSPVLYKSKLLYKS
jgi:hypothetical protein